MRNQLDARKTGWSGSLLQLFKSFDDFKAWYDPRYKSMKAEIVWRKIGGKIETKKEAAE